MSVTYVKRKCDCGGKLQYDKERKVWVCLYCGSEIEREEQYDGMFTIKNVVRQTIMDVAYRRLDIAEKNLVECQKIDSRYIGTIIANLCYLMIKATTPGACKQSEIKGIIGKIKRHNDTLQSKYGDRNDDEEALYEFFDSSDIYATLMLVYDSLNDKNRQEHMMKLLKVGEVFSVDTNKNLLAYSLKKEDFSIADGVIDNNDNIDRKFALIEILEKYPDRENKCENIRKLLEQGNFEKEGRTIIDNYLLNTTDSSKTKASIISSASNSGIKPSTDKVLKNVLEGTEDSSISDTVLKEICSSKLNDEEVNRILDYCFENKDGGVALAGLKRLKSSEQYVVIKQKHIINLLSRRDINAEDTIRILKEAYEFNLDNKSRDAIINNYLCFNKGDIETRREIITFLLSTVKSVQTNTVENYILNCNVDGEHKPEIVESVFNMDINISFYYNLLSMYIFTSVDDPECKEKIIDILLDKGIKVEPKAFSKFIYNSDDRGTNKVAFIRKMLANGSTMSTDTASNYLERINNHNDFDPELFKILFDQSSVITNKALVNYILFCKDRENVKVKNAASMSRRTGGKFGSQLCEITHNNNSIRCNLLQGYILISADMHAVTMEIIEAMINAKVKINEKVFASNGTEQKFKKYVLENRASLNSMSEMICEEYKVFSRFFR